MRKLSVTKLQPRMTLAKGIYTGDGRILLPTGTILQDSYIERLNQLDLKFVFITDELLAKAKTKEVISEPAWVDLQQAVRDLYNKVGKYHSINFEMIHKALDNIIYEIISNRDCLGNYYDWAHGEPLANHSVNVCILSLMIGLKRGYNTKQLQQLATGALLHDIGKALKNNSPQKTTADHTAEGFHFLKNYEDISLLSAHIAYQHHEKWDGSGLPRHLSGENIHEYARIVTVADTYDSLIREHELPPWAVMERLKTYSGSSLDPELANLFLSIIPTFPLGTTVQLSTNEKGVVVDIPEENPDRPVVWITDYLKQQIRELRLSEIPQIIIKGIILE